MSFGPKLADLPATVPPGSEIIATLTFTPVSEEFELHATIYVEEATGIRTLEITAKSVPKESAS